LGGLFEGFNIIAVVGQENIGPVFDALPIQCGLVAGMDFLGLLLGHKLFERFIILIALAAAEDALVSDFRVGVDPDDPAAKLMYPLGLPGMSDAGDY